MPHLIVEYSANLEAELDIPALMHCIHKAALETGVFPVGGVRTRAARRDIYEIADGHDDNVFIHVQVRIGAGRDKEVRHGAGAHIFKALTGVLDDVFASKPLGISLEISEIDPDFSFRKNNLHDYLKQRAGESVN